MEDYDVRYQDSGYHHDRRNHFDFSHHGHGTEYVVTKIEKYVQSVETSVHSAFGHKHPLKLASMELDQNCKGQNKDKAIGMDEARPKFRIAKWKHHELGNKLGHKDDGNDNLEKKEPPTPPAMINTGGWIRPNRAMWASPPNGLANKPVGSAFEPEYNIGQALEYLKEAGIQTDHSGSKSTASVKPRSIVTYPPNNVKEALDYMRETDVAATDNSGYRLTVAVSVRK